MLKIITQMALTAVIGLTLSIPVNAGIIINEIFQNPSAVTDSNGEWFELFNSGLTDIDINGWTFGDNDIDSQVVNNGGSLIISSGGFLVLGRNADTLTNGGISVDYQYSAVFLANGADELVLFDDVLNEIDRVEWDGGPVFPDPTGASMALTSVSLDNNLGSSWATSTLLNASGDFSTAGRCNDDVGQVCSVSVPEPSTLAIFALGMIGLASRRFKK
ncbi:lamin tail domain-containing protein [Colwellia sp. Bg11-28]|uniref:lamin tail domain-containing protein n=1 Tax=Colwellia sp. Bg11-28 TaxID=2058305 RepID=UPI0012FF3A2F|nr:lamin tail domain-containing protein [Colwellia sp. Bg11-28]